MVDVQLKTNLGKELTLESFRSLILKLFLLRFLETLVTICDYSSNEETSQEMFQESEKIKDIFYEESFIPSAFLYTQLFSVFFIFVMSDDGSKSSKVVRCLAGCLAITFGLTSIVSIFLYSHQKLDEFFFKTEIPDTMSDFWSLFNTYSLFQLYSPRGFVIDLVIFLTIGLFWWFNKDKLKESETLKLSCEIECEDDFSDSSVVIILLIFLCYMEKIPMLLRSSIFWCTLLFGLIVVFVVIGGFYLGVYQVTSAIHERSRRICSQRLTALRYFLIALGILIIISPCFYALLYVITNLNEMLNQVFFVTPQTVLGIDVGSMVNHTEFQTCLSEFTKHQFCRDNLTTSVFIITFCALILWRLRLINRAESKTKFLDSRKKVLKIYTSYKLIFLLYLVSAIALPAIQLIDSVVPAEILIITHGLVQIYCGQRVIMGSYEMKQASSL